VRTTSKYYNGLDSLRALAVLSVLLYHLDISAGYFRLFSAGFLGVDVFIVLSGYLIFKSLLSYESFTIKHTFDFLSRRILRIFPSILFIVAILMPLSYLFLFSEELVFNSKSFLFSIISVVNIFYVNNINYWSPQLSDILFLHAWSLSLEEQFYLFALFLVIVMAKTGRLSFLYLILLFIIILSLFTNFYFSNEISFYTLIGRAWEFSLGGMICYLPTNVTRKKWVVIFKYLFAILILASLLSIGPNINSGTHFDYSHPQSIQSIFFAILSAGLIYFIILDDGRFLPSKLLESIGAYIGRRSYSIYLVHWPIISFSILIGFQILGPVDKIVLFVVSIIMGGWLYFLIEKPFRYKIKKKIALWIVFFMSLLLIFINVVIISYDGLPYRWPSNALLLDGNNNNNNNINWLFTKKEKFEYLGEGKHIYVIGDSHIEQYIPSLIESIDMSLYRIVNLSDGHRLYMCENFRFAESESRYNAFLEKRREYISTINEGIIIVAGGYEQALKNLHRFEKKDGTKFSKVALLKCLEEGVSLLKKKGVNVLFFGPVPEHPGGLKIYRRIVGGHLLTRDRYKAAQSLNEGYPREEHELRNNKLHISLESLRSKNISIFYPADVLCPKEICSSLNDGYPVMKDYQHLEIYGQELVVKKILSFIK